MKEAIEKARARFRSDGTEETAFEWAFKAGFYAGFHAGAKGEKRRVETLLADYQGTYSDYIHDDFQNLLFPKEDEKQEGLE